MRERYSLFSEQFSSSASETGESRDVSVCSTKTDDIGGNEMMRMSQSREKKLRSSGVREE